MGVYSCRTVSVGLFPGTNIKPFRIHDYTDFLIANEQENNNCFLSISVWYFNIKTDSTPSLHIQQTAVLLENPQAVDKWRPAGSHTASVQTRKDTVRRESGWSILVSEQWMMKLCFLFSKDINLFNMVCMHTTNLNSKYRIYMICIQLHGNVSGEVCQSWIKRLIYQ